MARTVTGFYLDPPLFIHEVPFDEARRLALFDRFALVAFRSQVAQGIEMNATIDGQFGFDFSEVVKSSLGAEPADHDDFDALAESVVARTNVMNAFLAFFYTRLITVEQRGVERMVVTPDMTIAMDNLDGTSGAGFGNPRVSHLVMSRYPGTYMIGPPADFDSRLSHRVQSPAVALDCLQAAVDDLSRLIENDDDEGVVIVDLFLRAAKAYQDHNHSLSLISYWTIIERLINRLWQRMQSENRTRDSVEFIDGKRSKRLNDGRTFTAAVMSEMLSFQGYLDLETYNEIATIRRARNNWMHSLKMVGSDDSQTANSVCERLLKQVMDVTVIGASGRTLHG
ncbi:hypothetical protein [Mycolicibacterium nivoides]|uniref:hypothetical protein n=1 Tax=Mycolicibacterium nivoides TaxID=2487344 RepID=UPI000F5BB265|nr:hypothetical protein [Mycolicibacterium nivoides]